MLSPPLRLLFCHGLGSAKTDAQLMGQWAQQKALQFQIIQYKNYGDPNSVWAVNNWARDITAELAPRDQSGTDSSCCDGTVAVCVSAGAQALLRALWHSPLLAQRLAGLLLLSPGVCMELPNYVQRVLPDHLDALRAGLPVDHPSADRTVRLRINMESLKDYERNCVVRRDFPLAPPLHFPIRIVHGLHDKLVPLEKCVQLLHRLPARDKAMHVVPCGHVITDTATVIFALDSLWAQICENGRRREKEENGKVPKAFLG